MNKSLLTLPVYHKYPIAIALSRISLRFELIKDVFVEDTNFIYF